MDLAPQQKQTQHQEQVQEKQRRGSPSSMLKLPQSSPTTTKTRSILLPPHAAAACHPHISSLDGSNSNVDGCFKPDATENMETSRTTIHARKNGRREEDLNGKELVGGGTVATAGAGGGASRDHRSGIHCGAGVVPIPLGTPRADPFIAVERWPGCVNNNEYTIEAAGDIVLRSGAGVTAPSPSQTASTASARRNDCDFAESTILAEAGAIEDVSGSDGAPPSEGEANNDNLRATCSGRPLGEMPVVVDAAFSRLVKARDRAVASAWGTIVLAGHGGSASTGVGAVVGGEAREARGGDASPWGASATAAKMACNSIVSETSLVHFLLFMLP